MKIADRIITSLLAVGAIVAAIFSPLIHLLYQINGWDLLGITSSIENDTGVTEDGISVWYVIRQIRTGVFSGGKLDFSAMDERVVTILHFFIASMIIFAVAVLIALVLAVVCASTSAKKTQCVIAGIGIVDLAACGIVFNKFAQPIMTGAITPGNLIKSLTGGALGDNLFGSIALSSIVRIEEVNLSSAWVLMIMIFSVIIVWNVCLLITAPKDDNIKK